MTAAAATRADGSTPLTSPSGLASRRASVRGHTYRARHYIHPALTAAGPKSGVRPQLLASAGALVAFGGREPGLRGVAVALRLLANGSIDRHGTRNAVVEALLARATFSLTAMALAWDRCDALAILAGVARCDGYGPPERVLASTGLRHLDLYERGAHDAFQAHVTWLTARAWRSSIPPFADNEAVRVLLAEADIISGCLITADATSRRGGALYSAGVAQADHDAEDRLVARLKDERQRGAFRDLFSVPDEALDQTIGDAYSRLTDGQNVFPRHGRLLFNEQ